MRSRLRGGGVGEAGDAVGGVEREREGGGFTGV